MATGLRIPVGVSQGGGASLSSGDENDSKIIRLALGSDDNENAFQQRFGMGDAMIFDISEPTTKSKVVRKLIEIFRRFEAQQRYILRQNTIRWEEGEAGSGEIILFFKYVQIESDQEKEFRQSYSSDVGAATR